MTNDDLLFRHRLRLFALAGEVGVSRACRELSYHRSSYYRWKARVEREGLEILRPRERRLPRMPNQTSPWLEHQVLIHALGNPGLGPRRLAAEMALPRWGALQISATAVFNVLRRHGLNTRRRRLSPLLPPNAAVANPIDMTAVASAEHYAKTIEALASSGTADSIVVIFVPPLVTDPADVARALREVAEKLGDAVTLCAVFMSAEGLPAELGVGKRRIPSFAFPEEAALAVSRAAAYGAWRAAPKGQIPRIGGFDQDLASALLANSLTKPGWLSIDKAAALLGAYGIPMAPWRLADTPAEAGRAAGELTGPLALKAVSSSLLHKSDVGGVRLRLDGSGCRL